MYVLVRRTSPGICRMEQLAQIQLDMTPRGESTIIRSDVHAGLRVQRNVRKSNSTASCDNKANEENDEYAESCHPWNPRLEEIWYR